jgi:hypothetical protein
MSGGNAQISIEELPLPQLNAVKQQLEEVRLEERMAPFNVGHVRNRARVYLGVAAAVQRLSVAQSCSEQIFKRTGVSRRA